MVIEEKIEALYNKNTSIAYDNLLELESLSKTENTVYAYFDTFLQMMNSEEYVMRVRGYRLVCKQAKWDIENKINNVIDKILFNVEDIKPTAVRQKIKALQDIVVAKKELGGKIRKRLLEIDIFKYKNTMQHLIQKDIKETIDLIKRITL